MNSESSHARVTSVSTSGQTDWQDNAFAMIILGSDKKISGINSTAFVSFLHQQIGYFCSDINNKASVFFWHQQHVFFPMSTTWLSNLTTAGKTRVISIKSHKEQKLTHWWTQGQHNATIGLGSDKKHSVDRGVNTLPVCAKCVWADELRVSTTKKVNCAAWSSYDWKSCQEVPSQTCLWFWIVIRDAFKNYFADFVR